PWAECTGARTGPATARPSRPHSGSVRQRFIGAPFLEAGCEKATKPLCKRRAPPGRRPHPQKSELIDKYIQNMGKARARPALRDRALARQLSQLARAQPARLALDVRHLQPRAGREDVLFLPGERREVADADRPER